jgi:hypothetical protein
MLRRKRRKKLGARGQQRGPEEVAARDLLL